MPLPRPDLLAPIAGPNPSGENLRYVPIYDKIKEARIEEQDHGTLGDWQRTLKRADWNLVIKLTSEVLATKSKDLMLTSWLGEAMMKKQGITALPDTLELQRQMLEQFWDTLYPEIEDSDVEMRAM